MVKYLIINIFHFVPGVPRVKMERWNALPGWTHKLTLRLIESSSCTQLVKGLG
jgi:hypothetical protein